MSEWWTYSLRDLLLFSPRTYYRLFELYNQELWPLQLVALSLGAAILLLLRQGGDKAGRILAAILALCWLWVAWSYHYQRYANINWAANYYAVAFFLEALLLLWVGVIKNGFSVATRTKARLRNALILLLIVILGYPLLAPLFGRSWSTAEIFGMAPDPTALLTLCILLFANSRKVWGLYLIPLAWCLISGATLWAMGSPDYLIVLPGALLIVVEVLFKINEKLLSRAG